MQLSILYDLNWIFLAYLAYGLSKDKLNRCTFESLLRMKVLIFAFLSKGNVFWVTWKLFEMGDFLDQEAEVSSNEDEDYSDSEKKSSKKVKKYQAPSDSSEEEEDGIYDTFHLCLVANVSIHVAIAIENNCLLKFLKIGSIIPAHLLF